MTEQAEQQAKRSRNDRWLLVTVLLVFLVGLGIRSYGYLVNSPAARKTDPPAADRDSAQKPMPGALRDNGAERRLRPDPAAPADEADWALELAPYLTEGGLSFFIGFCIGYFLRVVAKTVIFVVGGLYVALILLSHYGMITVDWGSMQHLLQQILLNTKTQVEGLRGVLSVGVPSVAMGTLGIWRGFKKPS
jgi:uncharacterized membrane protein (Fun14 family)